MARMLQALKNLDARSVRRTGQRVSAPTAKPNEPQRKEVAPPVKNGQPADPPAKAREEAADAAPLARSRPTRRADAPPLPAAVPAVTTPLAEETAPPASAIEIQAVTPLRLQAAAENLPAEKPIIAPAGPGASEPKTCPPSSFEQLVRRTLSDPVRSQPLNQLAERLRRDAERTASKTLLLAGIGDQSATHETLVYAATLLAASPPRDVLLVDADLARRPLSEALDYGQEAGLAELLRGETVSGQGYRPTAVARLSFLPAGLLRNVDLSTARVRLEQVLQQWVARFALVLLDAGRTSDPAASVLARQADAAYFVVKLGTVETSEASAALRDFRAAGARVLGCIAT